MPGKVKVKVLAGRNLPVMDRGSDTTDAYVEIKIGSVTHKTDVCRKSLNPQWNTDWYRFEVDDAELQDEPLQIRLMDYDTYSANDAIGKVYISLHPLLLSPAAVLENHAIPITHSGKGGVMSGWIPVFDTMHGIRGEVNVIVKVELFSDVNKFRQSSCGVHFFHSPVIPHGYHAQTIHGFVDELVVNDDPEYQWIDKIRTPRASNEARQVVFLKLSGQVQRKIGLKALDLGANAVIGYTQCFDLEGDVGVVARGVGTAVTLIKLHGSSSHQNAIHDPAQVEEHALKYLDFLASDRKANYEPLHEIFSSIYSEPNTVGLYKTKPKPTGNRSNRYRHKKKKQHRKSAVILHKHKWIPHKTHPPDLNAMIYERATFDDEDAFHNKLSNKITTSKNIIKRKMNQLKSKLSDGSIYKTNSAESSKNLPRSSMSKKFTHSLASIRSDRYQLNKKLFDKNELRLMSKKKEVFAKVHLSLQSLTDTNESHSLTNRLRDNQKNNTCEIKNMMDENNQSLRFYNKQRPTTDADDRDNDNIQKSENLSSSESDSSSNDESQENIFDISKMSTVDYAKDVIEPILEPCLAHNLNQTESMNSSDHSACSIENISTSVSFQMSKGASNCTKRRVSLPRFSLNFGPQDTSFSVPPANKVNIDNSTPTNEHKFQKLLNRIGLSLHTAPITENKFNFDILHHKNKRPSEADLLQVKSPSRLACARRSFQFGSSDIKKPELKHADGLIGTAMQTILMDKYNIMGEILDDVGKGDHVSETDSITRETVLGSPFLSIADLTQSSNYFNPSFFSSMSCLKEESANQINSPMKRQRSFSLCETTADTILSDKVNAAPVTISQHSQRSLNSRQSSNEKSPFALLPKDLQNLNSGINDYIGLIQSNTPNDVIPGSSSLDSKAILINTHDASISDSYHGPPTQRTTDGVNNCLKTNFSLHGVPVSSILYSDQVGSPMHKTQLSHHRTESVGGKMAQSPIRHSHIQNINSAHRRSSDSDLSITPKGNSMERSQGTRGLLRSSAHQDNIDLLEYPFLTIAKYPVGFIQHLGGTVAARSVKLLERVPNPDEPETRDTWWTELRMEIRSHARALACNVVLGYSETTTISDDICVLSATGTAAVINLNYNPTNADTNVDPSPQVKNTQTTNQNTLQGPKELMTTSLDRPEFDKETKSMRNNEHKEPISKGTHHSHSLEQADETVLRTTNPSHTSLACSICHIPYSKASMPFRVKMIKCAICRRGKVPNVLFCTVEVPERLQVTGRGCLVQAHVLRPKRDLRSEMNAREISDSLPFLEYELHRLLISKLKVKGMNAIFGLKATVAIGERMIAAVATGTAVFLTALPPPCIPTIISGNSWKDLPRLAELQRAMQDTLDTNRDVYQLKPADTVSENKTNPSDTEDSDEELADLDLGAGNKDACIIEVDDTEDLEMLSLLMEPRPPDGFHVVNTQAVPGLQGLEIIRNLQTFVQVWRAKLPHTQAHTNFPKHFQRLLQSVYFKLRSMIPCAVCDLRFRLDLPEPDELQLLVTGMALGLGEPINLNHCRRKSITQSLSKEAVQLEDEDMIFSLEEEQSLDVNGEKPSPMQEKLKNLALLRNKANGLNLSRHLPLRERYGVDITPLSYVPGGRIDRYLGNLNFFFIRESTSIRENGGISGFVHGFITEILAVVRAHATALGGNAMVAYYMTELILVDNLHKNQGQCLVSVGGDVVFVSYFTDD